MTKGRKQPDLIDMNVSSKMTIFLTENREPSHELVDFESLFRCRWKDDVDFETKVVVMTTSMRVTVMPSLRNDTNTDFSFLPLELAELDEIQEALGAPVFRSDVNQDLVCFLCTLSHIQVTARPWATREQCKSVGRDWQGE